MTERLKIPLFGKAALACAVALLSAITTDAAWAQVDHRRNEGGWPYIEGVPNTPRYGDRRDNRPGYRPGDQNENRYVLPPGYRPGFAPNSSPVYPSTRCPADDRRCR